MSEELQSWHFGMTEDEANTLLALVLDGRKTATSSSLRAYEIEDEPLPEPGHRSVITDWAGTPGCIVEITDVQVIPFDELTFDLVQLEGEDDDLDSWQAEHRRFFTAEAAEFGYTFSPDMPVVFERFRVVEVLQHV